MKTSPKYPFQERVHRFIAQKERVGIFVFYGGGKTFMSLRWLESLYDANKKVFPALVLTMKSLVDQWGTEIEKHCSRSYVRVTGNAQQRVKALRKQAELYILNYDAVRSVPVRSQLEKMPFRAVIADESAMLKEARTFRFKTWRRLLRNVPYRALLSAKPVQEHPQDVWAQMLFLDGGQSLGANFWQFRTKYFYPGPPWRPYEWVLKPGAGEEISKQISRNCLQIRKTEIIHQLPPKSYNEIKLTMPEKTRKLYLELKRNFEAELPSGHTLSTQWAMVKASKMHQLCQGFVYTSEGWEDIDHTKLDWLRENIPLMLSTGPVLLWVCFKAMQQRIASLLEDMDVPFGNFCSELSQQERSHIIAGFNTHKYDVLLLSQQVGAAGLNLQRANQAVFVCTDFKAALRENAEERCHRIGSEGHKNVTYYDLVMKNSMDEVVLKIIHDKVQIAEAILAHIRS